MSFNVSIEANCYLIIILKIFAELAYSHLTGRLLLIMILRHIQKNLQQINRFAFLFSDQGPKSIDDLTQRVLINSRGDNLVEIKKKDKHRAIVKKLRQNKTSKTEKCKIQWRQKKLMRRLRESETF